MNSYSAKLIIVKTATISASRDERHIVLPGFAVLVVRRGGERHGQGTTRRDLGRRKVDWAMVFFELERARAEGDGLTAEGHVRVAAVEDGDAWCWRGHGSASAADEEDDGEDEDEDDRDREQHILVAKKKGSHAHHRGAS